MKVLIIGCVAATVSIVVLLGILGTAAMCKAVATIHRSD